MDKLVGKIWYVQFLKFIVFTISLLVVPQAMASQSIWSFVEHPHPFDNELSKFEYRELSALVTSDDAYCREAQKFQFELYRKNFPHFRDWRTPEDQFLAWKRHMMQPERRDTRSCIITNELETMTDLNYEHERNDFRFCGIFTRPPNSVQERQIASLIEEIFGYVRLDQKGSAYSVLTWNSMTNIVLLHPDVEYYFRAKFTPPSWDPEMTPRDTAHPNHVFTTERITFLDNAVADNNLQSVIDTMGACKLSD